MSIVVEAEPFAAWKDRKLKTFKGEKGTCLTQFVEKYPEKKVWPGDVPLCF